MYYILLNTAWKKRKFLNTQLIPLTEKGFLLSWSAKKKWNLTTFCTISWVFFASLQIFLCQGLAGLNKALRDFWSNIKFSLWFTRAYTQQTGGKIKQLLRCHSEALFRSLYVSGKLLTYPSPEPTFCPKWEVSVTVKPGQAFPSLTN